MYEQTQAGLPEAEVAHAVEVKVGPHWRVRYGWFLDYDRGDPHTGLERAQIALPYALNEGYEEARIVRRATTVEVVCLPVFPPAFESEEG